MPLRLCLAALLLPAALLAADNWPQFRGPDGNGTSDAKGLPTKWGETENVRWKTAIHDKGWSSPVVWGDKVWVTTATEDGTEYFAVGLDRKTGKVVHDVPLFSHPAPQPSRKSFNSYASPTPAVDEDGRLYAHFGTYGTACVDTATGKVVWKRDDLPCDHWRAPGSSPVVWRDRLFLLFDGFDLQYVACLDKKTGDTLWKTDRNLPYKKTGRPELDGDLKKAFATPAVFEIDGRPQLVAPAAMGTAAYDPETGKEIWRVIHGGMNEASRPILAHGLIFVTCGDPAKLIAFRPGGTGDITQKAVAWKVEGGLAPSRPSPIVLGDLLFMVSNTGSVSCYEAKTGRQVWKESLPSAFVASPVSAGGVIYFPGENGKTFVVAADRTYQLLEENKLADGCKASPAIAGDAIFLRTFTHLYCIGNK